MSALAKPVRAIALMAVLVTGVALTGCTGDSDPKASTTSASAPSSGSSSTPSPSVVPNKDYDLDGLTRPVPQIIETKTDKGQSFGLTSIVRVGEDRVVVSGVLTPATPLKVGTDAEPGFLDSIGEWPWLKLASIPAMLAVVGDTLFKVAREDDLAWYHQQCLMHRLGRIPPAEAEARQ